MLGATDYVDERALRGKAKPGLREGSNPAPFCVENRGCKCPDRGHGEHGTEAADGEGTPLVLL